VPDLDIDLPDINGLDLQRQLASVNHPPILFITGPVISKLGARAQGSAVDFLTKPFSESEIYWCDRSGDREGQGCS